MEIPIESLMVESTDKPSKIDLENADSTTEAERTSMSSTSSEETIKLTTPRDLEVEVEDLCDSQHLLDKNTSSFRCLAQLMISSSSLAKHRLFLFPPLADPGIDEAYTFEEPQLEPDDIGAEKYKSICKELDIVPISRILKHLQSDELNLKYYGLSKHQIRGLCEAMRSNSYVESLILQENWLSPEMTQMVTDMLVENTKMNYLSLKECRIGEEGAKCLGEAMSTLNFLRTLDLSYNDIGDSGLLYLRDGLCENLSLKSLNISHNGLTEDSGETWGKIFQENKSLEEVDLSWNGFFTQAGNKLMFAGLMKSDRLRALNLAWNGIGIILGVRPIARYIRASVNLEELDLSNNRLVRESLLSIRGSVNHNHSLKSLKIGGNIYTPSDAHTLLTMMSGKINKDPLRILDMSDMYIGKESKPIMRRILNSGRLVKIGGILSDYEIKGPDATKLLYERCRFILNKPKKAKARKDFGHLILSLPDHLITTQDFEKEVKKRKMKKLDKELLNSVMNLFMNKKKQIDCQQLVTSYMSYYPETTLPPQKSKKKGKGKKGKKGREPQRAEEIPKKEQSGTDKAEGTSDGQEQPPGDISAEAPVDLSIEQKQEIEEEVPLGIEVDIAHPEESQMMV